MMRLHRRRLLGCGLASAFTAVAVKAGWYKPELASGTNRPQGDISDIKVSHEPLYQPAVVELDLGHGKDFTAEIWYSDGYWHDYITVRHEDGVQHAFLDGVEDATLPGAHVGWGYKGEPALFALVDGKPEEVIRLPASATDVERNCALADYACKGNPHRVTQPQVGLGDV